MSGERDELIEQLWERRLAQGVGIGDKSPEINEAVTRFQVKMDLEGSGREASCLRPSERTEPRPHEAALRRTYNTYRFLGIAVAIIIAVIGINYLPVNFFTFYGTSTANTYSTANGERLTISLDDGSKVTLAPGSKLTFTSTSGKTSSRVATLEGEAIFDVTHSAKSPFSVTTGNNTITVLGTRFGVRKYPEDIEVRIAVEDGKIAANGNVLSHGDVAYIPESGNTNIKHQADVATLLSWTSGMLSFSDATLAEVLPVLSRWYDVDFVMADPTLGMRRLTTTLDSTGLTNETLTLITSSLGIRFTRVGRTITLYPGN